MGKGIGYTKITMPTKQGFGNVPAVVQVGGEELDEILSSKADQAETSAALANKANSSTVATKLNQSVIAPAFSKTSAYAEGDYVIYSGELYVCTKSIEAGNFNAADWSKKTVVELIASLAPDNNK